MADQIAFEVFSEVLADLTSFATRGGNVNAMPWSLTDIGDENMQMLPVTLNKIANDIARKTRRGCGNFVVTTPIGVSLLQSNAKSTFVPAPKGDRGSSALMLMGTLNGTIKVYSSMCLTEDMFLVGYKGGSGEVDTGYIYSPYVPVMPSGPVIDPNTFQPIMTMMTRYGKFVFQADDTAMASTEDYYGVLKPLRTALPPSAEVDQPQTPV